MSAPPKKVTVIIETEDKQITQVFTGMAGASVSLDTPTEEVPWWEADQNTYRTYRQKGYYGYTLALEKVARIDMAQVDVPAVEVEWGIRWSNRDSVTSYSKRETAEMVLRDYLDAVRKQSDAATGAVVCRTITRSPWMQP